jgi:hypothetical protein
VRENTKTFLSYQRHEWRFEHTPERSQGRRAKPPKISDTEGWNRPFSRHSLEGLWMNLEQGGSFLGVQNALESCYGKFGFK